MRSFVIALALVGAGSLMGCTSREPGTCEKDSHCTGAEVCFESKCVTMKEREKILQERKEAAKPKVCEDQDGDGSRAGNACPAGQVQDCNDKDPAMTPGKAEVCDNIDNNCDGRNNEDLRGCVQTLFGGATWGTQAEKRLEAPRGVLYDPAGFVLVTDSHHVWKVALNGQAEVLAGSNLSHFADARGEAARFSYPGGINRLPDGSLAVADCKNNCVRRVGTDGTVSTLAGQCSFLTKNAGQFADGPAGSALFYCPSDVFPAPDGSLVVVDQGNARIRRVAGGQVTTLAGVGPVEVREGEGQIGFLDGPAEEARFNDPQAVLVDGKGVIYVSESFNCRIRKLEPAKGKAGEVSTLAGESSDTHFGIGGWVDGAGKTAKLNYPHGMAFDEKGNFIVADAGNAVIRLVTPAGQVRTLVGKPGELKFNDGPIDQATFQAPVDVAPGPNGSLFVIDGAANRLRWIVP